MAELSKFDNANRFKTFLKTFFHNQKRKGLGLCAIVVVLILVKLRLTKSSTENIKIANKKRGRGQGQVDTVFLKRIMTLLKIVIPKFKSQEVADLLIMSAFLVGRSFLSIYIANVQGRIVKGVIDRDWKEFLSRMIDLGVCAVPASFINSYLDFLNKRLSINFKRRLTHYFHDKYMKDMMNYQITNIDSRISNPDQRLTADIDKWANSLSSLYSNFTKPLLDLILFSRKLSDVITWKGPFLVIFWYFLSGFLLRLISPPFGKLTAIEQKLEGEYRACHSDLVHHSEEIAFFQGQKWERGRIHSAFDNLIKHTYSIVSKRLYMGCFDAMLVKYGAVVVGYAVVGIPVFGAGKEEYLKKVGNQAGNITKDYVRNSSLLINLAKAIGRLVVSYKEIQMLAGYTTVVYEIKDVISDLEGGKYVRTIFNEEKHQNDSERQDLKELSKGQMINSDFIKFDQVPITTPSGEKLVKSLDIQIDPGMHCIITGPNGCGKSSLFRILGSLWPIFDGKVHRPSDPNAIFYVPQRPYLPRGTLRDQLIYPHSKLDMLRKRIKDEDLKQLLDEVFLGYLPDREGGLDAINDWNDVLSGGEKQRIAMGRLIYHKPQYAILDECTSAVSIDVEGKLYQICKQKGITLFTVSHRGSLFKHHDYLLKFDGEGEWSFEKFKNN